MRTVTVTEMDYNELEEMVQDHYGITDFSIVACEEWGNDEDHKFTAKKEEVDEYDQRRWSEFIASNGNANYMFYNIITHLTNDGFLPEGDYILHISW